MYELIVLGLIPGTQLQITFVLWIMVVLAVALMAIGWIIHRSHAFRDWYITLYLFRLSRHTA
jgi:hypothetical protein